MKDLGTSNYFLGIEATFHMVLLYIFLSTNLFGIDILTRLHMDGVKPISTPAVTGSKPPIFSGKPLLDLSVYRTAVGHSVGHTM